MGSGAIAKENPGSVRSRRIPCIDGLRAIAILFVLAGHSRDTFGFANWRVRQISQCVGNARLGVLAFFVISGFLITKLLIREWQRNGSIGLRTFYLRRVLRIFPAFYAYLASALALRMLGAISTDSGDLLAAGTFTINYKVLYPSPPSHGHYWFVGHFWTLSLEEQFYACWPLLLVFLTPQRAGRVATAIVIFSPVMRTVAYVALPAVRSAPSVLFHFSVDPIMVGCLAALWEDRVGRIVAPVNWLWPCMTGVHLIVAAPMLEERWPGQYLLPFGITLDSVGVAFLLIWVTRAPSSLLAGFLETSPMRRLGVLSYSLYLWQQPFLTKLNHTWSGHFPANMFAALFAAHASYRLIERPFLRLKERVVGLAPTSRFSADIRGEAPWPEPRTS